MVKAEQNPARTRKSVTPLLLRFLSLSHFLSVFCGYFPANLMIPSDRRGGVYHSTGFCNHALSARAISLGSLVKVSFRQNPQAFGTYGTEATGVFASETVKHATRVQIGRAHV